MVNNNDGLICDEQYLKTAVRLLEDDKKFVLTERCATNATTLTL